MADVDQLLAPILNAMSPNLSAFKTRGGMLIGYHGWADPIIQPQDTIDYYYRVAATQGKQSAKALAETQTFFRLFMVTWMNHFFFFQAEDGIRDLTVTGVQTCALPI